MLNEIQLPSWCGSLRPHQRIAIHQILKEFETNDVVVLDAPTGSGKTLIGYVVAKALQARALYLCHSLALQDQFVKDFPEAKVLKGRSNYPTANFPERFGGFTNLSAADCTANGENPCQWCNSKSSCPYEIAKVEAMQSPLAVLNGAYFLTEANGPGRFSSADLIVWDECDTIESDLLRYVEVQVPDWLNLGKPEKVTKPESWRLWVEQSLPKIQKKKAELNPQSLFETEPDVKRLRRFKRVEQIEQQLKQLHKTLTNNDAEHDDQWVLDHRDKVTFRPVKVNSFGEEKIWRHGKKWLLMSASVISPHVLMDSLGYNGSFSYVKVPATFPPENRLVLVRGCGSMARNNLENSKKNLQKMIRRIRLDHHDSRILIHSVSYALSDIIVEALDGLPNVYTYTESRGKEEALRKYLSAPASTLIAPSMDRGVDLPGDACRVQVIAKVPYPNLGDKQISARLYTRGGQAWYGTQTVRTLVQMTGRGVRSKDDHCLTYILDSDFLGFLSKNRNLFPKWWIDSLKWKE